MTGRRIGFGLGGPVCPRTRICQTRLGRALATALAAAVTLSACAGPEEPAPLHAAFGVTLEELTALIGPLPESVQERILAEPAVFLDLMAKTLDQPADLLVLVDKEHALAEDYRPADLVVLDGRGLTVTRPSMTLRAFVLPDLAAMTAAARLAGTDVTISSAYRSYARQDFLFDYNVERLGLEQASTLVARPGHSQHQLGTAVDFGSIDLGYGETHEGQWVLANAWRFGFSLSYPQGLEDVTGYQYEPWHFRYVGRAGAELERRFFGIQQVFLSHYRHLMPSLQAAVAAGVNAGAGG